MGQPDGEAVPLGLIPIIDVPGNPVLPDYNAADRYTERISYDKNSNITSIERYGMNNQRQYGQIDSLVITRNGNQLKTIEDHAEKHLTYTGASDFYDGYTYDTEYYYDANGAVDGWHYYIQDYMGNNRMVVNKNGTTEQVTHYYPYGGVIGDISTNENVQKYKFEGKELDRTFGLDNYDIHARQYFAMAPMWDRIDPMAEKYYGLSPYAYCGGDPINILDYDGEAWIKASYGNEEFYCYDPAIQTQEDINNKYYYGDNKNEKKITLVGETGSFEHGGRHYNLNEDGSYSYYTDNSVTSIGGETDENGLHIGQIGENQQSDNLYGNYLGDHNPRNDKGKDSYCLPPIDELDYAAFCHDKAYDAVGARGLQGVASLSTMSADLALANSCFKDNNNSRNLQITQYSQKRAFYSNGAYRLFGYIGTSKLLKKYFSIEFFFR